MPQTDPILAQSEATGGGAVSLTLTPKSLPSEFLSRCLLDPDTGCWLWTGKMSHGRSPIFLYHGYAGSALKMSWELFRGSPPSKGQFRRTCGCDRCVRPDHLRAGPETGKVSRQSPFRKLSPDAVLEIRSSLDSKHTLAQRYNVSEWTIWAVKKGVRGKLVSLEPPVDPKVQAKIEMQDMIEKTSALLRSLGG